MRARRTQASDDVARRLANAHARDGLAPGTLTAHDLLAAIDRQQGLTAEQ